MNTNLIPLKPNTERSRAGTASETRDLVKMYFDAEQGATSGRAQTRAACQKQYDMRPPRDVAEMARASKRHLPNADWGEHRRMVDEAVTPAFRVRMGSSRPVNIQLNEEFEEDDVRRNKLGRYLSTSYGKMIRLWRGRQAQEELSSKWMTMFGLGPIYFPHKWSWQYKALHPKDVILPRGAKVDPQEWPWFAIVDDIPLMDFSSVLEQGEDEETGWNVEAVKRLFSLRAKTDPEAGENTTMQSIEDRAAEMKRKDLYASYGAGNDMIKVYQFYVREPGGRWTQLMLLRDSTGDSKLDDMYLYKDEKAYESAEEVLVPMTVDNGEGTWHSIRGLSVRIHKFCSVSNDSKNHAMGVTKMLSGLLLQPATGADMGKVQEISLDSPITLIPPGFNAINQGIPNPTKDLLGVDKMMQDLRDRNVAGYGAGSPEVGSNQPVGTARLDFARSAELKEADKASLYMWSERLHLQVIRRIKRIATSEESPVDGFGAKEDQDTLDMYEGRSKGFKLLYKHFIQRNKNKYDLGKKATEAIEPDETTIRRAIGEGNPAVLEARLQQLTPLKAELSAVAVQSLNRHVVDSIIGPDMAEEFFPESIPAEEIDQRRIASLEHGALAQGIYVPVSPTDNALIHIPAHLDWAELTVQGYAEGQIAKQEAYQRTRAVVVHVAQQDNGGHLGQLLNSESLRPLVDQFQARLNGLLKFTNQIEQELRAEAEAARQQQADREAVPQQTAAEQKMLQESATRQQIAKLEALASAEAKLVKAQGQNQTKQQSAQDKAALAREELALKQEIERLKVDVEKGARNAENQEAD